MKEIINKENENQIPSPYDLTSTEKDQLRARVFSYVNNSKTPSTLSPFWGAPRFKLHNLPVFKKEFMALASACVFIIFIGGTAFANSAGPGDILYPFKIHISEKLMSALSFTDKAKANTHLVLAERRMAEIEELNLEKQTNLVTLQKLSTHFENEANNVNKYVDDLKKSGNIEDASHVSGTFEAKIDAHKKILMEIGKVNTASKPAITTFLLSLDAQNESVEKKQEEINAEVSKNQIPNIEERTEKRSLSSKEQVEKIKNKIEENTKALEKIDLETERQKVRRAEDLLNAGTVEIQKQNFKEAFVKQQKANKEIEEAETLLNSKIELGFIAKDENGENIEVENPHTENQSISNQERPILNLDSFLK